MVWFICGVLLWESERVLQACGDQTGPRQQVKKLGRAVDVQPGLDLPPAGLSRQAGGTQLACESTALPYRWSMNPEVTILDAQTAELTLTGACVACGGDVLLRVSPDGARTYCAACHAIAKPKVHFGPDGLRLSYESQAQA
jgi:hypothetical protein